MLLEAKMSALYLFVIGITFGSTRNGEGLLLVGYMVYFGEKGKRWAARGFKYGASSQSRLVVCDWD